MTTQDVSMTVGLEGEVGVITVTHHCDVVRAGGPALVTTAAASGERV